MDNENKNKEKNREKSVEDQTVERLNRIGSDINEEQLADVPVTPPDEESCEPSVEETAEELCVMCGEKPADKSFGEDYDLCADCRQKLVNVPLSFPSLIILILIIGIGAFGCLLSSTQLPTLKAIREVDNCVRENRLLAAVDLLEDLNSSNRSIGWKTARRNIPVFNRVGTLGGINTFGTAYFYSAQKADNGKLTWADKVGKADLNAPWNKEVKVICDDYDVIMSSYEEYYSYFSQYYEQLYYGEISLEDIPYDDLIKKYEDAKKTEKSTINIALINYCEYRLSVICEKEKSVQIEYMKAIQAARPDFTWLYLDLLTGLLIETGDYQAAEECCKQIDAISADIVSDEYYRAMSLRRQGKYDDAIKMLDLILGDYETNGYIDAYYEAAVCAFCKKDYQKSLDYLKPFFESDYNTYASVNLYALLGKLTDNGDEYTKAADLLQDSVSPTVEKYLKKEITAEAMFNGDDEPFEYVEPEEESETAESEAAQ